MFDDICVNGITPLDYYPSYNCKKFFKQCISNDIISIPTEKPDIECIDSIGVKLCINGFCIIKTIVGPKLIIKGFKNIKVMYTADNCQQSIHSAHWSIPFCEFMLLDNLNNDTCRDVISSVFIGLESVCIKYYDNRFIDFSTLFVISPCLSSSVDCCSLCTYNCDESSSYCNE